MSKLDELKALGPSEIARRLTSPERQVLRRSVTQQAVDERDAEIARLKRELAAAHRKIEQLSTASTKRLASTPSTSTVASTATQLKSARQARWRARDRAKRKASGSG